MRIRPSHAAAAIGLLALTACGANGSSGNGTSDQTGGNQPAISVPTLPSGLPVISDEVSVEKAQRELISLAAQFAVGIPNSDRNPTVTVVDHNPCRLDIAAGACQPTTASQPVPIEINPNEAWAYLYQSALNRTNDQPAANAAWQSETLGAYTNYLMFRQTQRTDPRLLTSNNDADAPTVRALQLCKQGNVLGPLWTAMGSALQASFQGLMDNPDFINGSKGNC